MKKVLINLTGIVFLITILLAAACGNSKKQNEPEELATLDESTTVNVFLKEIEIGESMHLLMYDSRKSECPVIDGLISDVNRGDTVKFRKGKNSRIESVEDVRLIEVEGDPKIYKERFEPGGVVYYQLILDTNALQNDTFVKYEIHFMVKGHKDTTYIIDPYLRLPRQTTQ